MSGVETTGLPCGFIVGVHTEGVWKGFEKPCGIKQGTRKDPRSDRYDDGLCPTHWQQVFSEWFCRSLFGLKCSSTENDGRDHDQCGLWPQETV